MSSGTREYYSPYASGLFESPRESRAPKVDGVAVEEKDVEANRAPSRADEAPEWVPPEARHNGQSGWIHTIAGAGSSEKVPVPSPDHLPAAERNSRRVVCGIRLWIVILILTAAIIIALGLGLGLGLGLSLKQSSLTSPGQAALGTGGAEETATSNLSTSAFTSGSITSDAVSTITTKSRPSYSLGNFNNIQVTAALAASPGGTPTTTITIASVPVEPTPGSVQMAPVFHSSAFDPASYLSTLTYTAATSGATQGIGAIDCPQANNAAYIATDGAVFQKLCYADVALSPNFGSTIVASLNECIEMCLEYANSSENSSGETCKAVSYSANLTLAVSQQSANCWFKIRNGYPSPGDWQESTASLMGYLVGSH